MKLSQNTIAVVTGGASGLGAATAKKLAQQGARVAVLDRDVSKATAMAKEIDGVAIACDVADADSVSDAMKAVQQLGALRVCVNCAGVVHAKRLVGKEEPMPLDEFHRVLHINLLGTFNVMRLAANMMSTLDVIDHDQQRGVIINTASIAAFEGQIGQVAYSASKAGVAGMTLPAARELAQFGVRVVTIAPGLFQTPMMDNLPEKAVEALEMITQFPKRLGLPDEFAKMVLHVIDNTALNGTVIRLDGAVRLPS